MRDPARKSSDRAAALRTCAAGFLRARAQRYGRTGDRAQKPRFGITHVLCAHSPARYRARAVPMDDAAVPLRLHARLPGGDVRAHTPKPRAAAVTSLLEPLLREQIAQSGPIPFREFMQAALYHPEHGYYRR